MSEWIRVKDELPPADTRVLIVDEDKDHTIASMRGDEWSDDYLYSVGYITHWMPLPEPPCE